MRSQSFLLEQCFEVVTARAPLVLQRCLRHVVAALQEAEAASSRLAERTELADAWRELQAHEADWCDAYPRELRAAFAGARQPPARHAPDQAPPGELRLVGDDEVLQTIAASQLVAQVAPLVEQPAGELDALVSSVLGLDRIQPELNPLRPEVFAQTLRKLVARSALHTPGPLWMKHLAQPLGAELQALYAELIGRLRAAHVPAAGFAVRAPGRASPRAAAPAQADAALPQEDPTAAGGSAAGGAPSAVQISHSLLREFLRHGGADDDRPPPPSYFAEVERELAAMGGPPSDPPRRAELPAGYRELPAVERPVLPVDVHSMLSPGLWGEYGDSSRRSMVRSRLRRAATRVAQVLGLDLVRKVVNEVAQDPRLLAPVREALVALEPSLLRLAMVDPRFFSDHAHPGRLLIERVAQQSFRYNDEFSTGFGAFFDDVSRVFNGLNALEIASGKPFELALLELQAVWEAQERADEARRREALQTVQWAERRQAAADQLAAQLRSRPDVQGAPPLVQEFVCGPWSLVMAHARERVHSAEADPGGYAAAVGELLWSVDREVTLRQPARLFVHVPPLLAKLREGLALLGQPPQAHEPFFQGLMKLHQPVLKLRRTKLRRDGLGSAGAAAVDRPPAGEPPAAEFTPAPAGQPWMSRQELDAAGFQETQPLAAAQLQEPAGTHAPQEEAAPPDGAALPGQLRAGDWVDLYSQQQWLRAKLIWCSSKATLFMFVSHGGQPHSMTRRTCERLIRERHLRPVSSHSVVEQALGALDTEPTASEPGASGAAPQGLGARVA